MFPYIYLVRWYDETNTNPPVSTSHGLTMGCNLFEATKRVVEYFGEENIAEITMTPVGDGSENIYELTEEQAKQLKEQTL